MQTVTMTSAISPNATEICDGIDNNCDASIDGSDAVNQTTWYFDSDADGHGDLQYPWNNVINPQTMSM